MATHEFPAAARHKAAVNGLTLGSWVYKAAKTWKAKAQARIDAGNAGEGGPAHVNRAVLITQGGSWCL